MRAGSGLGCMELFRDGDDASGEEIKDFESNDERHPDMVVTATIKFVSPHEYHALH